MQSGSRLVPSPQTARAAYSTRTHNLRAACNTAVTVGLEQRKCHRRQSQGITSLTKSDPYRLSANIQCAKIGKQIFYIKHIEGFFSRSLLSASDRFKLGRQTWILFRSKFNSLTGFICWPNISLQVHQICFHQRFIFIGHTSWEILLNPPAMGFVCTSIHLALERLRFSDRPQTLLKQKPFLTSFI